MRFALPAALLALFAAAPALATQGLRCAPTRGTGPALTLIIGHGPGPALIGATLTEAGRTLSTGEGAAIAIGQSWIDGELLWLDLTDANATTYEARLRARFDAKRRGRPAIGTLAWKGRTYSVRCVED